MEILENIALPQSPLHIELLSYLIVLTLLLLLPYISVLFGSTLLSIMFNRKGRVYANSTYIKFSKKLIDLVTFNKSAAISFTVIPIISIAFIFTQLLQNTGADVYDNLIFAVIILFSALILIFTYKYSFHLSDILNLIDSEKTRDVQEFQVYKEKTNSLLLNSGPIGFLFLSISIYILIGAIKYSSDSTNWGDNSLTNLIFSAQTLISFLYFISLSMAMTSVSILYILFKPGSEYSKNPNEESQFIRDFCLKTAMIFTIVQPVLFMLELFTVPKIALSSSLFVLSIFILALLLLLVSLYYFMLKDNDLKFRKGAFVLTLLLFLFISVKDQVSFDTSSQLQVKNLLVDYEQYETEFKSQMGIEVAAVSGEDIFNVICSACHNFETKIVGPPYIETLVKYEGKRDDLIDFILNPKKINPDYPAMPNQGLKPNQAEAVADYIIRTYEQKYK